MVSLLGVFITGYWDRLGNIGSFIERGFPLVLWLGVLVFQVEIWLTKVYGFPNSDPIDFVSWILISSVIIFISLDIIWRGHGVGFDDLDMFVKMKLFPSLWWIVLIFAAGLLLFRKGSKLPAQMIFIFIAMWFVYQFTGFIARWYVRIPEQAYFPYLAESFLHGKLYLENPISYVELTPNNGHWYVPYPPLAAILMLPMVSLWGAENVNSSNFSIFFAALSVSLVFAILESISRRGWSRLGTRGNIWLAGLLAVSTPLWQIAISGEVWYINQVLTLAFVAASILLVVLDAPPVLAGIFLGLAMLARPTIALMGLFLFSVYWQIHQDERGRIKFLDWLKWGVLAVLPVLFFGMAFLWYNHARFGSFFDFGYVNMNIGEPGRTDIQTYGQFNTHFISRNIKLMFFGLPYKDNECNFLTTKIDGMSMFVTTPALLYIFGSFRKKTWVVGAWLTSIAMLVPLVLYFATGIFQFGYRYVLDFFIPLLMLIASTMPREKLPLHVRIMILAGVLINYWGVWWFYRHWCR
jgi:hypothetical protein